MLALVHGAEAIAETAYPRLEATLPFELQNDFAYESDDPAVELNNTFAVIEPEVSLQFSRTISVEAGFVFENVRDPVGDRFFEDQGLFVEQLFLQYAGDGFALKAGKFNPAFGVAWDLAPGIYGVDFAEDYELTEKVGFGADVTLGDETTGEHTLSAATYFADTSVLSQSFLTSRGETRIGSSGPSNTEDFSSFAVSLGSEGLPALGGMGYSLGIAHQAAGVGNTDDETSYAAAIFGSVALSDSVAWEPLAEYIRQENAGATIADRDYLTLGSAFLYGPWNLSLSYTGRNLDPNTAGTSDVDDTLLQVSGGYEFDNGVTADLGYRFSEEASVDTHMIGILFTYELGVSLP